MRIIIAGQGKSGTTALYHALRQSLPADYAGFFEPQDAAAACQGRRVLVKMLIRDLTPADEKQFDGLADFDRKILIVRDPRDNFVSRLLYSTYDQKFFADEGKVQAWLDQLERKRREPARVPVIELYEALSELSGVDLLEQNLRRHHAGMRFHLRYPDYSAYRYEEFVAGGYRELEDYLGFALRFDGNVAEEHRRVERTRGTGDWKNWFTPWDVEFLREVFADYIALYGYDMEWQPSPSPEILPEHSTGYVMRLIAERRVLSAGAAPG